MELQERVEPGACRRIAAGVQERVAEIVQRLSGLAKQLARDLLAIDEVPLELSDRRAVESGCE
jgi:hypothetical protein